MHAERTAVVVGAYRRGETLERCLTSLQNMAEHPEDLIFVDNGSKDGLATWVHSRFPRASVVRLEQNLLYCGGYNAGIKEAIAQGYDYVLILNADTEVVQPGTVDTPCRSGPALASGGIHRSIGLF